MFGKLNSRPAGEPQCPHILVSESSLGPEAESYEAAMCVVDFVNEMTTNAHYRRDELPQEAFWLYHADYYVGEVLNGGHSQFIGNSQSQAGGTVSALENTYENVAKGLRLVGAERYGECFEQMCRWISTNEDSAANQNGFSIRADALEELDTKFYEVVSDEVYYNRIRDWLSRSELVRVVPDADWDVEIEALKNANPLYDARMERWNAEEIQGYLINPYICYFSFLWANMVENDRPVEVTLLSGHLAHPRKPDEPVWRVQVNSDELIGFVMDSQILMVQPNPPGSVKFSPEGIVAQCRLDAAEAAINFHKVALPAAAALELLKQGAKGAKLKKIFPMVIDPNNPMQPQQCTYFIDTQDGQSFYMALGFSTAILASPGWKERYATLDAATLDRVRKEFRQP